MAVISHENVVTTLQSNLVEFNGVIVRRWSNMALNDSGAPFSLARYTDKTVQVTGTFGSGGTVVIEASLDGTNYETLKTVFGADLSFTAGGIQTITEVPVYLRPRITAGDGTTSITVTILVR
jgi:hypothetical protein